MRTRSGAPSCPGADFLTNLGENKTMLEIRIFFGSCCLFLILLFSAAFIHARYDMWRLKKKEQNETQS